MFLKTSNAYAFPPPLPKDEEQRLFRLCRQGDMDARSKLIEHNLRLVAHIVKKYYTTHKEQDDLISIGTIGLIKAIDSFDVTNGARFATYAGKCLQNEILMYFRSRKSMQTNFHQRGG
jgi:RNA polymerase sporulation-specific sigma factor